MRILLQLLVVSYPFQPLVTLVPAFRRRHMSVILGRHLYTH
jgi:hypothetical protein